MSCSNEKDCLNSLKNALLGKREIDVFSNCNLMKIEDYIFSAIKNNDSYMFPDFIFEGGCIEHFELTSSKETKKGSSYIIEKIKNDKRREEEYFKIKQKYLSSKFSPNTLTTVNYKEIYEDFSYEDFLNSLERNISKHVKSLEKSNYKNQTVIFLMEQQTARLWIDEGVVPIKFYELNKDKKALLKIKEITRNVDYLLYFVHDSLEILDLSLIDSLIANSVEYKNVKGGRLVDVNVYQFLDL